MAILKPLRFALLPFAMAYGGAVRVRNRCYDSGLFGHHDFHVPIVSIGNITAGGTGKTPVTQFLVQWAAGQGLRPVIVSRGYRGSYEGVQKVLPPESADEKARAAALFGDEPVWYATRNPDVPVYVGRDRVAAVSTLLERENPGVIFADDAFQHRRLGRRLDIVILDATEPLENYLPLPVGRARESWSSLLRAQAIILNKVNLAEAAQVQTIREQIALTFAGRPAPPVFEMQYRLSRFQNLVSGAAVSVESLSGKKAVLVSGIGKPETFGRLLKASTQADLIAHLKYRDHHAYDAQDFATITQFCHSRGVEKVLVTEKDAVKMQGWTPENLDLLVSRLELAPVSSLDPLYVLLAREVSQSV